MLRQFAWLSLSILCAVAPGAEPILRTDRAAADPAAMAAAACWREAVLSKPVAPTGGQTKSPGLRVLRQSHLVLQNTTAWKTPITLGSRKFDHGIYMDAPAAVEVRLPSPGREFSAVIGIDNNGDTQAAPTTSSARFHVSIAGRRVYSSKVRKLADGGAEIRVPLGGAAELTIETDDGGDGRSHDQCVWAAAAVTLADGSVQRLGAMPFQPLARNRSNAPFYFRFGGRPSDELLPGWEFTRTTHRDRQRRVDTALYRDPATRLCVELSVTSLDDTAAVDWTVRLRNEGRADTPPIEDLLACDGPLWTEPAAGRVDLRWSNGDRCAVDSYLPHDETLTPGVPRRLAGHASNVDCLPFFNLRGQSLGCVAALGWCGRWRIEFLRQESPKGNAQSAGGPVWAAAGMQQTHFTLRPGESVRTPRVALLYYTGDMTTGHNRFRRMMLEHYVRRCDGVPATPPVAYASVAGLYVRAQESKQPLGRLNEAYELRMLDIAANLGCEAYWMDAYWFPQPWYENMGNWIPRPADFPRGLRPLADAAHRRGMRFVTWFAPMTVSPNTPMAREHPQFIHGGNKGGLWKIGDPAARRWLTDWVSQKIDQWAIDIYRQDIDGDMPPEDNPSRLGVVEMKHVEGFYDFWSALLERHPRLAIDNCFGGGRRIELETSCRAFTLWRSDFNDIGEGLKGKAHWPHMGTADQVMIAGLSMYLPFFTGPCWDMRPYCFRSAATWGVVLYNDLEHRDFSQPLARQAIAELKSLRPLATGDFYPLAAITADPKAWWAYQLDRPDLGRGAALVFRRPGNEQPSFTLSLAGIDPKANYEVRVKGETYASAAPTILTGDKLRTLACTIPERPGSALVEYRRIMSAR